jgi:hypothetical protein
MLHDYCHSNVIFIGCLLSGGGAEAIIGGVEYGTCEGGGFVLDEVIEDIADILSKLLDLTNNLSLCLQQISKPVVRPPI